MRYKERKEHEKHVRDSHENKRKRMEALMLWLELKDEMCQSDDENVTVED